MPRDANSKGAAMAIRELTRLSGLVYCVCFCLNLSCTPHAADKHALILDRADKIVSIAAIPGDPGALFVASREDSAAVLRYTREKCKMDVFVDGYPIKHTRRLLVAPDGQWFLVYGSSSSFYGHDIADGFRRCEVRGDEDNTVFGITRDNRLVGTFVVLDEYSVENLLCRMVLTSFS
jgi:hypothetical protein